MSSDAIIITVIAHYKAEGIDLSKTRKANWELISTAIINHLEKYAFQNVSAAGVVILQNTSSDSSVSTKLTASASTSCRRSSTTTATSDIADSPEDSPSTKIPKLSTLDKENIKLMYDRRDRIKMWKLSTGTVVEDRMRDVESSRGLKM
ncbi:hypothetical protein PS6_008175 [Mucor atramentarius]